MSTSYSISDNVSSSLRADASVPVWTSLNERTLSDFRKKQLIAPYQLQSKMRIDLDISPLGNEGFKNSIKTKLLQMMIDTIKHKTTFTQMNDDSNVVDVKAKVYVFSEQELLQFIDRCRE